MVLKFPGVDITVCCFHKSMGYGGGEEKKLIQNFDEEHEEDIFEDLDRNEW